MEFALGYIAGIATCAFLAIVLGYFRRPIISKMTAVEAKLSMMGPKPKGFIFDPEPEADIARREHIEKNAEQGKDTPIAELL